LQEWTNQHDVARLDNAGEDLTARHGNGGQCGSKLSVQIKNVTVSKHCAN